MWIGIDASISRQIGNHATSRRWLRSPGGVRVNFMFTWKRKNECVIPKEALADPDSREVLRAWIANEGLHVSLWIPDAFEDPGHWGIVLTDVMRHLADAYQKSQGVAPEQTIARIQEMIEAELKSPTDKPTGGFVKE